MIRDRSYGGGSMVPVPGTLVLDTCEGIVGLLLLVVPAIYCSTVATYTTYYIHLKRYIVVTCGTTGSEFSIHKNWISSIIHSFFDVCC